MSPPSFCSSTTTVGTKDLATGKLKQFKRISIYESTIVNRLLWPRQFCNPAQRKLFIQIMSISQKRRFWTCRILLWTTLFNSLLFKIFQTLWRGWGMKRSSRFILYCFTARILFRAFSVQPWMFASGRVDERSTVRFCFWHRGCSSCEFLELENNKTPSGIGIRNE